MTSLRLLFAGAVLLILSAPMVAAAQLADVPHCCRRGMDPDHKIRVLLNCTNCDNGLFTARCDQGCINAGNPHSDCCWYLDKTEVERAVHRVIAAWNFAEAEFTLHYGGQTTLTSGTGNDLVIFFEACLQDDLTCAGACGTTALATLCGNKINIPLYKWSCPTDQFNPGARNRRLTTAWSASGNDLQSLIMHEIGHILGLKDLDIGSGTLRALDCSNQWQTFTGGPSVMEGPFNVSRKWYGVAWPEDKKALQTVAAYGVKDDQFLKHKRSTTGNSWDMETDPGHQTSLTPAVAFGMISTTAFLCTPAPCPTYVVSWVDPSSNSIRTARTTGQTWESPVTTSAQSDFAPGIAFKPTGAPSGTSGYFMLVYVAEDSENTRPQGSGTCGVGGSLPCVRRLFYMISEDGVTWSAPSAVATPTGAMVSTLAQPTIAFAPASGRFVLVYSNYTYNDNTDGLVCSMTWQPSSGTSGVWGAPVCIGGADAYTRTVSAPSVACAPTGGSGNGACSISYVSATGMNLVHQNIATSGSTQLTFGLWIVQPMYSLSYPNVELGSSWFSVTSSFFLSWKGAAAYPTNIWTAIGNCGSGSYGWDCLWDNHKSVDNVSIMSGTSLAESTFRNEMALYWSGL